MPTIPRNKRRSSHSRGPSSRRSSQNRRKHRTVSEGPRVHRVSKDTGNPGTSRTMSGDKSEAIPNNEEPKENIDILINLLDEIMLKVPSSINNIKPLPTTSINESNPQNQQARNGVMQDTKKKINKPGENIQSKMVLNKEGPLQPAEATEVSKVNGSIVQMTEQQKAEIKEGENTKSKADLKKERRLQQEAQRAAKAAAKEKSNESTVQKEKPAQQTEIKQVVNNTAEKKPTNNKIIKRTKKVLPWVEHLRKEENPEFDESTINPATKIFSLQMRKLIMNGCNARVVAMLKVILEIIEDYEKPERCDYSRGLLAEINVNLAHMRAHVSFLEPMDNVLKFIKRKIQDLHYDMSDSLAEKEIVSAINLYISKNIVLASKNIAIKLLNVLGKEETILTFGYSDILMEVLKNAKAEGRNFRVVLVDSKVGGPTSLMYHHIKNLDIPVSYTLLQHIYDVAKHITHVIVEAEAVSLNGAIVGNTGLNQLLLSMSDYHTKVLVVSQMYKLCFKERTNALSLNELGNPDEMISKTVNTELLKWKDTPKFSAIKLLFDLTPPDLYEKLVTERGIFDIDLIPLLIEKHFGDILCQ